MKKSIAITLACICGFAFADSYKTIRHAQISPTNRVVMSIPTWAQSDTPPEVGGLTTNDVENIIATNLNKKADGSYDIKVEESSEAGYADEADAATVGGSLDTRIIALENRPVSDPNAVTNVFTNGVSAVVGKVARIVIPAPVSTNGLASVGYVDNATNATLAAAKADAAGKYLPLTGGLVNGKLTIYGGPGAMQKGWENLRTEYHQLIGPTVTTVLPDYLASLEWVGYGGHVWHTLGEYKITDAYTKTETETVAAEAAEAVVGEVLEYGLTNLTANTETFALSSGFIGNLALDSAHTNINLTLTYPTANDKSADILLRVICGANTTLAINSQNTDVDGTEWTAVKTGTNYVTATRTAFVGGRSKVLVAIKEIK